MNTQRFITAGMAALTAAATLTATTLGFVTDAHACGGTFCDSGPPGTPPMPVDQTGENVLFSIQDGYVEAHVQIQYTGDPERFAWIVPMQTVPEVSVGSQLLFLELLNSSVPTYQLTSSFEFCGGDGESSSSGCTFGPAASEDAAAGDGSAEFGGPNGNEPEESTVEEVLKESVGSFEVTVLEAQNSADISVWLADNGYLDDEEAAPVLDEYIQQGYVFVALKLTAGAGIDEIHPLTFRFQGDEPCIPLKLTRIAASEDMGVRAFFLGDSRVVPTNYRHVELNEARLDWLNFADNYVGAVSRAVDEPGADGRAFVTEYAGSSSVIQTGNFYDSIWNNIDFSTVNYLEVTDILSSNGLLDCNSSSCTVAHPLLLGLLRDYLPAPQGVAEAEFYQCVGCYYDLAPPEFDSIALQADFEELIVDPAQRAKQLVDESPYLTRLFTTISPDEMTEDPMFTELRDVPLTEPASLRTADQNFTCEGDTVVTTPSGLQIALDSTGTWPAFTAEMPWASRIQSFNENGELIGEIDNAGDIDTEIASWNGAELPDPTDSVVTSDDDGCGCSVPGRRVNMAGLIASLGFAAVWLRRRRRNGKR